MRRVVIESPYAGDVKKNIAYAKECMRDCLMRNEAPLASHLLYTQDGILDDTRSEERLLGMEAGFTWNKLADVIVVYTDLGITPGMEKGIELAKRYDKKIEYRSLEHLLQ